MNYFLSIYFFISIVFTPFLIYKALKMAKYTERLEENFLSLIQMLEESNEDRKNKILKYIKNTEVYKKAMLNKLN